MGNFIATQLEFDFSFECPFIEAEYYRDGAQDLIRKLVPQDLLAPDSGGTALQRARFADMLPLIRWSDFSKAPCSVSALLLCKYRLNACTFFCNMISRWLLPQRHMNVDLFFTSDVRLPHLSEDVLSVAEVVIYLRNASEVEEVRRNLHALETEIRLGVTSDYYARRILEFKGLSSDGKTAMIQEKIGSLIQSHSKDYDNSIFSQMQQFLVNCPEDFKTLRNYHHISRIISNLHSVRKLLKQNITVFPSKRHVILKFLKTRLAHANAKGPAKEKPVLGILAGLNFLREHEVFEEEHLAAAIKQLLPTARLVQGSWIVDPVRENSLQTVYLEMEKEDASDFTLDEIQQLKTSLEGRLKEHIEQLAQPIYMPRNDEEVLRNIMALSRQIRFANDLSQVIISFDESRGKELCFTVILVRIVREGGASIQELFLKSNTHLKFIPDRVRTLGALRRKYAKEAIVFRTSVSNDSFLRSDRSVDLYKARQHVYEQLSTIIGELRDYNGGMILKQNEQLTALRTALGKTAHSHSLLVEKFFHSLAPMEMRTSCETEPLKQLFLRLLSAAKHNGERPNKRDPRRVLAVVPASDPEQKKLFLKRLESLRIPPHQFVSASLEVNDASYLGLMLLNSDQGMQERFLETLKNINCFAEPKSVGRSLEP